MPRIRLVPGLLALALTVSACGGDAPEAEAPDPMRDLARQIFHALKADDVDQLSSVLLTADDVRWTMERFQEAATPDMVKGLQVILDDEGGPEGLAAKRREKAHAAFRKARDSSAKVLDWSKAQYVGIVDEQSRSAVENGVEGATIHFMVKAGERDDLFIIPRALNVRGVWMTVQGVEHQQSPHASMTDALVQQTKLHLRSLESVIQLYKQDHSRLPTGMEELFADSPSMKSPYLGKGFGDAWGNPIAYEALGVDAYRFRSGGPDGTLGTDDDIFWPEPEDDD